MVNEKKIIIGDKIFTREQLFKEKEKFRREQARLSFKEKIKALVSLQKIAYSWGGRKDVMVWRI